MKRTSILLCIVLLSLVALASAQAPPAPKPGPELQRLNYFAGNWKSDSDMKANPWGPAGKVTSKDRSEWMPGKFFLVTHSTMSGAMGPGTEMAVMGYKADEKVYTYDAFDSIGNAEHYTGTVSGDTWTWNGNEKQGGKSFKGRFIIKEVSPTSYTFKFDMQPEGGAWSTIMEGKSTKMIVEKAAK